MKTGRNSPCTCGSGMKYKQCCEAKEGRPSLVLLIGAVVIGIVIVAGAIFVSTDSNQQPPAAASVPVDPGAAGQPQPAAVPGAPQPPGPAPAGKVWNTEHGHWHDAPGAPASPGAAAQPGAPAQPPFQPGPQPPGPVPAGKVWSTEHGHWHDAPKGP